MDRPKASPQSGPLNPFNSWVQSWITYLSSPNFALAKRVTALETALTALTARVKTLETENATLVALTGQLKVSGDALVTAEKSVQP